MTVSWGAPAAGPSGPHAVAHRLLDRLQIAHLADRFPHELSSGQLQLTGLALTLARPSHLLVLDEPEQRLDTERRGVVAGLLRELRDEGRALVVATHSPQIVDALATEVLDLDAAHPSSRWSSLPSRVHRLAHPQSASGDGWYAVYASLLVGVVVGLPLMRGAAQGLGQPSVLPFLEDPPVGALPVGFSAAIAAAALVGGTAGPAVLTPFLTVHLGGNHLSRARTLLRPFLRSAVLLVSMCLVAAGTSAWTLWNAGAVDVASAVLLVLIAGCAAWIVSVVWLAGQACTARARAVLVLAAVVAGAATSVPPVSLFPVLWSTSAVGAAFWVVGALVSSLLVPRLLVRLRGDDLLNHARRRDLAAAAGRAGEVGHALSTFRPLPRVGRRMDAVAARAPFIVTIVRRDIVGALRTPVREPSAPQESSRPQS